MIEETKVPEPDSSGSSGKQVATANRTAEYLPARWQAGTIPEVVEGLVADKSRVFGSPATSALVAGLMRHFESENSRLLADNESLQELVASQRDDLESARISNARLSGQIDTGSQYKRLRRTCISLSALLITLGVTISEPDLYKFAFVTSGIVLLVVSFFLEQKKADQ